MTHFTTFTATNATASIPDSGLFRKVSMNNLESGNYIDYLSMRKRLDIIRDRLRRPLTCTEKLLYSHLAEPETQPLERGKSYLKLLPDRLASHDATAQTVLLQLMSANVEQAAKSMVVYPDHFIVAETNSIEDLGTAWQTNREVWDFLQSACAKYNVGLWKPGSGIFHQVLFENYAYPGGLLIGTDSHTPNAGGLGMCAIGVGGRDLVDVLASLPWELKAPKIIGVRLTGRLNGWAALKDIILNLAGKLTAKGGTGSVMEYFEDDVESLSCTGMATICNMGAEIGATTSLFPITDAMHHCLSATQRRKFADYAKAYAEDLRPDPGSEEYYDQVIDIDLSALEPHINGPFTPDLATPLSKFADAVRENGWPEKISVAMIGSCTNASYEDMSRAASVAMDALDHGLTRAASSLTVTPGSELTRAAIERDGHLGTLIKLGGVVLANACGPCIGYWNRSDVKQGEKNSILTSYNRNFSGRNDGNAATHAFVASPEVVVALSLAGSLTFNPFTDELDDFTTGSKFKLQPPSGSSLPSKGFKIHTDTYQRPPLTADERAAIQVAISPTSDRLQVLARFPQWSGENMLNMPILIKTQGKTTTDAIKAAGPWLRYRGHLDNISNNLLIGATNAANCQKNKVRNTLTGKTGPVPVTAREYKRQGVPWVVIGDDDFGEGSSREHAALEIRHLGGVAVIARSFARIHETNLKKQGVLPLTFASRGDYGTVQPDARIDIICAGVEAGKLVTMLVHNGAKEVVSIELDHTLNEAQLEWFRCGSALNAMKRL